MSHTSRQFDRFDAMTNSPNPQLAIMPKGTLPARHMTSRAGDYKPEAVFIPNLQFAAPIRNAKLPVAQQFYDGENRKRIVEIVVKKLNEMGTGLRLDQVPARQVDIAMKEAYTIYGMSTQNAPQAPVGPSESMQYLAPASKYHMDFGLADPGNLNATELERLNNYTAGFLLDGIISEKALIGRYHKDLGGAIHVLEYPSRPGPELRRGHQLVDNYYNDIGKDASQPQYSGLQGNNLSGSYVNDSSSQSAKQEPNIVNFQRRL